MKFCILIHIMFVFNCTYCQDVPDEVEIENMAEKSETITEDDSHWEELQNYHRHPLNINRVTEAELNQLGIVSNVQVHNFISYRSLLGKLVHLNELQAVPGWTTDLVRKLLPYITVEDNEVNFQNLWTRWNKGHYFILTRGTQQMTMAASTNSAGPENYAGGPQHLLLRFQYSFGNLLSYGVLLEKDAGETLFGKRGFDFYSFHVFLRRVGILKRLAIGDFTVKMGQGLIQWQGMGETKSANVLSIKRQREIIAPYHSPGEFEFYRGVAFSIEKKKWELNCFGSIRRLTATLKTDSIGNNFVSSILTSGYHRTHSEISYRNDLSLQSFGSNISYSATRGHFGFNFVSHHFSTPIKKADEPYQLFAVKGSDLCNWSVDYSYVCANLHVFGELAFDEQLHRAFLNGILISLDRSLDLSMLIRTVAPKYDSFNSSAFTENDVPGNENGIYTGLSLTLSKTYRLDAYLDIYHFPWLRFGADAPSVGKDLLTQFTWTPSRRIQFYSRYKFELKEKNNGDPTDASNRLIPYKRSAWRMQINWDVSKILSMAQRLELVSVSGTNKEEGFLSYIDLHFHGERNPFRFTARLQMFETDSYASRIYAFENDVLYSFSSPAYYGKGWGFYFILNYKPGNSKRKAKTWLPECWLKCGQSLPMPGIETAVSTQLTSFKTSITVQCLFGF